ncbi:MAG: hypothetical protein R3C56_12760 [Pirellulaceae bacterium]
MLAQFEPLLGQSQTFFSSVQGRFSSDSHVGLAASDKLSRHSAQRRSALPLVPSSRAHPAQATALPPKLEC